MTPQAVIRLMFQPVASGRLDTALLLLRLFVGTAFVFHGAGKVVDLTRFAAEFQISVVLAAAATYTQLIGALLLFLGFMTPVAALSVGATMAVAMTQLITRGERFVDPAGHSWEAAAFYVVANLVLVLTGPGRWSVDALLWFRRVSPNERRA